MRLSRIDRIILDNQYAILEKVDPDEADFCKRAREIIQNGYVAEYADIAALFGDEMTVEQSSDVGRAYEALADKTGIDLHLVSFRGFDGNNDGVPMRYAEFLRKNRGFENVLARDLSSHHPTLDRYRSMVRRWKESADRFNLTREDVLGIAAAR